MLKVTNEQLGTLVNQPGLLQKLKGSVTGNNNAAYRIMKLVQGAGKLWETVSKEHDREWKKVLETYGFNTEKNEFPKKKTQKPMQLRAPTNGKLSNGDNVELPKDTIVMVEGEDDDLTPEQHAELGQKFRASQDSIKQLPAEINADPIPIPFLLKSNIQLTPGEIEAMEPFCSEDYQGLWEDMKPGKDDGKVAQLKAR